MTWWSLPRPPWRRPFGLARRWTDIAVDPTGTAGLAGLLAARQAGLVADGARVGVLFTGADRAAAD